MKNQCFPAGDEFNPASIRGESILAMYQKKVGPGATVADLIADVLAAVQADSWVAIGEARAEGEPTANIDTPESVVEEAQASLEAWEARLHHEAAAEYERSLGLE